MAKIKIEIPSSFSFSTAIDLRITDLNYGNHVGNDSILSIIHEARVRFLQSLGFSELDVAGVGLIMRDVMIEFKKELLYGDEIIVRMAVTEISKAGFDLIYVFEKIKGESTGTAVVAKTGMVCFNYDTKKIAMLPEKARVAFEQN